MAYVIGDFSFDTEEEAKEAAMADDVCAGM